MVELNGSDPRMSLALLLLGWGFWFPRFVVLRARGGVLPKQGWEWEEMKIWMDGWIIGKSGRKYLLGFLFRHSRLERKNTSFMSPK